MSRRTLIAASAAVVTAMVAASLVAGSLLPPGIHIAVHWNAAGEANGFAPKWPGLLILPGAAAVIAVLFAVLPRIEPARDGLARSAPLYAGVWAGVLALLAVLHGVALAAALGAGIAVASAVIGSLGVLFIVIGNYLPKSRRMYFVGIRTPWTLADEDVWIATHRLAGKLMVAAGLVLCVLAVVRPAAAQLKPLVLGAMLAPALVPAAYSYLLWRRRAETA